MDDEIKDSPSESIEDSKDPAPSQSPQDPVKIELEKQQTRKLSRRERLEFAKNKIDQQLDDLDQQDGVIPLDDDKDKPVTVAMLEKREKDQAHKNALELAEDIEEQSERELTKIYLRDRIRPSGNPKEDLKLARAAVNSLRNAHIAEEIERKTNAKPGSGAPGAPATHEDIFEPTDQERVFMQPPYNVTKEDILKVRAQEKKE